VKEPDRVIARGSDDAELVWIVEELEAVTEDRRLVMSAYTWTLMLGPVKRPRRTGSPRPQPWWHRPPSPEANQGRKDDSHIEFSVIESFGRVSFMEA